jgi:hypothetical protein
LLVKTKPRVSETSAPATPVRPGIDSMYRSRAQSITSIESLLYLKLALVSCPIALHAACSTAERIAFRQVNKATGNRLRQQLIDEETREPVAPQDKGRPAHAGLSLCA